MAAPKSGVCLITRCDPCVHPWSLGVHFAVCTMVVLYVLYVWCPSLHFVHSVHYGCTNGRRVPHYQVWSRVQSRHQAISEATGIFTAIAPDNHYPTIPTIIILSLPIIAIIISQSSHSPIPKVMTLGRKVFFIMISEESIEFGPFPWANTFSQRGLNLLIFIFVYLYLSKWVFVYLCSLYFPWTDTISWRSPLTEGWPHSSLMIH